MWFCCSCAVVCRDWVIPNSRLLVLVFGAQSRGMTEQAVRRDGAGRFTPGSVANPGGRVRKSDAVRKAEALARERSPQSMRNLMRMADDAKLAPSDRIRCEELILAYGIGKPVARTESVGDLRIVVQQLTVPLKPVPGVLNSPVVEHIAPMVEHVVGVAEEVRQ